MTTDALVVVVAHNSAATIVDLLRSVPAAMPGLSFQVTVVDNGSSDDTVDVVQQCGGADRLIRSCNLGYSGGLNAGVAGSPSARAILILNPDTRLLPGSVPPLLAALRDDRVGVVAPTILDPDGTVARSLRRAPSIGRATGLGFTGSRTVSEYVTDDAAYVRTHDVDWALGAALAIDPACYETLNGWDESYFLYSEETDFCLRARDAGWRVVFEPRSRVVHIGGGSGRSDRTHAMQIVNRVRLYRRRHGRMASWTYFGLTIAGEISWIARGHANSVASVTALVCPARRPAELRAPDLLPI